MTIQILIVEDDPLIAMDLKDIVQLAGYKDVRTAATVNEARTQLEEMQTGFIFMDINLDQRQGGTVLAAEIRQKYSFPFAFVTANTDDETLQMVQQTKPVGFIVKPFDEKEILAILKIGIFSIKNQQRSKPQSVTTHLIQRIFPILSEKETKVLLGLYEAKSNQVIANDNCLSVNTIKTHLKSLYLKIDVTSRMEAVQKLMSKI